MSREVPERWSDLTLGDLGQITGGTTPSRDTPSFWEGGSLFWATPSDITALPPGQLTIDKTKSSVTEIALQKTSIKMLPVGSVLMTSRATIGFPAVNTAPMATNQGFANFLPSSRYDASFLAQWIIFNRATLENAAGGSTFAEISKTTLKTIPISLPPLHEQRRIAEILSSVDEAVAATRAVIEQTKKVKQGVLERLLTKGIGHTRFKQTVIGEIPEGWKLATLEELLADIPNPMRSGPFGSALKSEELVDSGVPFLGIDNIRVEQFVRNFKRFLAEDKFRQLRRFAVNPNDVVITIMGTVGRCCVIPPDIGEAVSSKHIWAMSLHHERYIPELACWQMNFAPWIVSKFTTSAQGGIMSAINSGILRKLVFPVPGLEEQRQILQIWQSFQSELQVEQAKLQNLEALKSALMSDLLTGRRRVTDALPMAAE